MPSPVDWRINRARGWSSKSRSASSPFSLNRTLAHSMRTWRWFSCGDPSPFPLVFALSLNKGFLSAWVAWSYNNQGWAFYCSSLVPSGRTSGGACGLIRCKAKNQGLTCRESSSHLRCPECQWWRSFLSFWDQYCFFKDSRKRVRGMQSPAWSKPRSTYTRFSFQPRDLVPREG